MRLSTVFASRYAFILGVGVAIGVPVFGFGQMASPDAKATIASVIQAATKTDADEIEVTIQADGSVNLWAVWVPDAMLQADVSGRNVYRITSDAALANALAGEVRAELKEAGLSKRIFVVVTEAKSRGGSRKLFSMRRSPDEVFTKQLLAAGSPGQRPVAPAAAASPASPSSANPADREALSQELPNEIPFPDPYGRTKSLTAAQVKQIDAAAKAGDPKAEYLVGDLYRTGDYYNFGFGANTANSLMWYRKSAEQGYARAISMLYSQLLCCNHDGERASEGLLWLNKAVDSGDPQAQSALADFLLKQPNPSAHDRDQAIDLLYKSAPKNPASVSTLRTLGLDPNKQGAKLGDQGTDGIATTVTDDFDGVRIAESLSVATKSLEAKGYHLSDQLVIAEKKVLMRGVDVSLYALNGKSALVYKNMMAGTIGNPTLYGSIQMERQDKNGIKYKVDLISFASTNSDAAAYLRDGTIAEIYAEIAIPGVTSPEKYNEIGKERYPNAMHVDAPNRSSRHGVSLSTGYYNDGLVVRIVDKAYEDAYSTQIQEMAYVKGIKQTKEAPKPTF